MSLPMFFVDNQSDAYQLRQLLAKDGTLAPDAPNQLVELHFAREELKHMAALRLRPGERFVVSDGAGVAVEMELADELQRNQTTVAARACGIAPHPYRPNLTLVQGISKGERMELEIRQCVELGVKRIVPTFTARCIVRMDQDKRASRTERWRSIALAAAKQSGQPVVPQIEQPMEFDQAVQLAASEADVVVIPYEESRSGSIADVLRSVESDAHVFLFIGPEGGFEPDEVQAVRQIGGRVVSLGDTILRTETAGTIASALAIYELGGLGNVSARKRSATGADVGEPQR